MWKRKFTTNVNLRDSCHKYPDYWAPQPHTCTSMKNNGWFFEFVVAGQDVIDRQIYLCDIWQIERILCPHVWLIAQRPPEIEVRSIGLSQRAFLSASQCKHTSFVNPNQFHNAANPNCNASQHTSSNFITQLMLMLITLSGRYLLSFPNQVKPAGVQTKSIGNSTKLRNWRIKPILLSFTAHTIVVKA